MRVTLPLSTRPLGVAALGALLAAGLALKVGPIGLLAPLAFAALLVPLANPRIALGLLVASAIMIEDSSPNVLHFTESQIHDPLPGHYSLLELLMALAVVSVLLDATRRRRVPLRPAPFGPALAVLVVALLVGSVVGHYAGAGFNAITEQLRPILPLIIVPWLTVNAVRDLADLRRAIGLIGILTAVKAALGLVGVLTHVGVPVNGTTITYYEATSNMVAMVFLLVMLSSAVARLPMERIALWALPLVLLSLALSLRRSFWIGTVVAAMVAIIIATAPVGRRFLLPGAAILAVLLWITFSNGVVINSQSTLGQRLASISPSRIESNPEDSYRLDEQKNVLAEIRGSPLVGLGLAIPWKETSPLSIESPGGRLYVHMAVLYFWLKLGVLGVVAYLGYMITAIVVGIRVFWRHHDPRIRAAGAGAAAALVGLAVVEATATFLGSDMRMTVLIGCVVGLLSVAFAQIQSTAPPLAPAGVDSEQRLLHSHVRARRRYGRPRRHDRRAASHL